MWTAIKTIVEMLLGPPGKDGRDGTAGQAGQFGKDGQGIKRTEKNLSFSIILHGPFFSFKDGQKGQFGQTGAQGLSGGSGTPGEGGRPGQDGQGVNSDSICCDPEFLLQKSC